MTIDNLKLGLDENFGSAIVDDKPYVDYLELGSGSDYTGNSDSSNLLKAGTYSAAFGQKLTRK